MAVQSLWPAHGIASRQDLPLPLGLTVAAAATAVVVSFAALGVLWRTPRLNGREAGRPLPTAIAARLDGRALRRAGTGFGLLAFAWTALALVAGHDTALNPAPWIVFVLLWIGMIPVSLLLGGVYRAIDPLAGLHRILHRALRLDAGTGVLTAPTGLGWWPVAAGLFAFAWLELVAPERATLPVLRVAVGLYVAVQMLAGAAFGGGWFDRGETFAGWFSLVGRLSPLGRRADGRWVLRHPLAGLDAEPAAAGLVAVVCVALGSTFFDALSGAPAWFAAVQSGVLPPTLADTLGLLGCVLLVAALFIGCTRASRWLAAGPAKPSPSEVGGHFAPSLVPVAAGYLIAHYWSLLVIEGQRGIIRLGDPLGTGADWFGLGRHGVDASLVQPRLVATLQVLAIVTGHVLGVALAHDRALQLYPRHAVRGQLPLLALMVAYTCAGLLLLFAA